MIAASATIIRPPSWCRLSRVSIGRMTSAPPMYADAYSTFTTANPDTRIIDQHNS